MRFQRFTGLFLAALLLLSGCRDTSVSCPPAEETTTDGTTTSTTTATTTTTAAATTTTTAMSADPVVTIPAARELLGQTYGDFLELTGGDCHLIHARFHTDVAFGLESDRLPHYELLDADNALRDWEAAVYGDMDTAVTADMLRTEQLITAVYVKTGGQVTASLRVGDTIKNWQAQLPSLPDMTILYDFSRGFNKGFYGRISTTIEGVKAYLYIDLTTDAAVQALTAKGIAFSDGDEVYNDPWLGKTVSLPELPVGGVQLWLEDKG